MREGGEEPGGSLMAVHWSTSRQLGGKQVGSPIPV